VTPRRPSAPRTTIPAAAPEVMNAHEAADYLRLSIKTLEAWRPKAIGPPFVRAGARIVYRKRDLDDWLERNVARTKSSA
jgi:hypothetical protein